MRQALILLAMLVLGALAAISSTAQPVIGCCCDPVVKNGSLMSKVDCDALHFIFAGPPPTFTTTCGQHCNATLQQGLVSFCGDGICGAGETSLACPKDCAPVSAGCGSPTFRPAPRALNISPVKGKKQAVLSFEIPCPADFVIISRCEGRDCSNFTRLGELPVQGSFVDEDGALKFNTDYTYSVVAQYGLFGESEPATGVVNLGDIECSNQADNSFCVSAGFYDQFEEYLSKFGYGPYSGDDFSSDFGQFVGVVFGSRFNNAWTCKQNILTGPLISCDENQACVSDEQGSRCMNKEDCSVNTDPFGLFGSQQACEGFVPRYCFWDRSTTVQNRCYDCDQNMNCYDYKSEGACRRDNCGAGECEWKPVVNDLGIGVCRDKRRNNCVLCDLLGTKGMENVNASSRLWDVCREEKSSALSTLLFPCFFDKDKRQSKSCDAASCADYSQVQCGAQVGGIRLDVDNKVVERSSDTCGIGVCEFNALTGCVKNADGSSGAAFADCKIGNKTCERDYFPPVTTLVPSGRAGRWDSINISIFDKINHSSPPRQVAGKKGYSTFLCVKSEQSDCEDARFFTTQVSTSQLIVKNLLLKDGKRVLATLVKGNNTIDFYSKDPANNVEVRKEVNVFACDNCNGPTLLNVSVTGGRVLGSLITSSAQVPTFTFEFDEPVQVSHAELTSEAGTVPLRQLSQGMVDVQEFAPTQSLLGNYTLTINGQNSKGIFMDSPGLTFKVVIDPSLAEVVILPVDGSIINDTKVQVTLNFSRPVTLSSVTLVLESFADPFVKRQIPTGVTEVFKSSDNMSFTGQVSNVTGGMYTLVVDALGFNGLSVFKQSSFFVATQKPSILLAAPTFGVTPVQTFNAIVETPLLSKCAYVFNTPSAPNATDFDFFKKFDGDRYVHTVQGLQISDPSQDEFLLHVYCKFDLFGISNRTFRITLDPEPPDIVKVFAEPNVIAEAFIPDTEVFQTRLKVQLDKPGFCKFSNAVSTFGLMEGVFPGFDVTPKESLSVDVNVTERKSYTYYVTCKGKNQLVSEPKKVEFSVDLTAPLTVTSSTPAGFNSTNFTIGVVANKRVFCYFGERADAATTCMGSCKSSSSQGQEIVVPEEGKYTYFVKCAHASGETSKSVEIPVLVDLSAPQMDAVSDDSALQNTDVTWSQNKIRVSFSGHDNESGIAYYLVSLQDMATKKFVIKDLVSNETRGQPFYISTTENGSMIRLHDQERYKFVVRAVNKVGLVSAPMETDGVLVDSSQQPEGCVDGERNNDEVDVDCGGSSCNGCEEGKACVLDKDCVTNFCQNRVCKVASCTDKAMNGLESDVDCGGQACSKCEKGRTCMKDSDCGTNYCNPVKKVCEDAPLCADKLLSEGETDIDCGGPCDKCKEGKACVESSDCASGLSCVAEGNESANKLCSTKKVGDADGDGVLDDVDKCPNTPLEEEADKEGCAPSQKFSLHDDINDKWRLDHFKCVDCADAAADADSDKDSLTNIEEFRARTDPTKWDTDGDGWSDGAEVQKGTDPLDPASHPSSVFSVLLWILLIGLLGVLAVYGGFMVSKMKGEKKEEEIEEETERVVRKGEEKEALTAKEELERLHAFARREEIPKEEWVELERKIKRGPMPKKKLSAALERLRTIAHEEKGVVPGEPMDRLRAMLDALSSEARFELLSKFKLLQAGLLSKKEMEELLKRLKIAANYYNAHKDELEKELERYGKRRK